MKIFLILISTFAFTAQADFSKMTCKKVISDELQMAVKQSSLTVQWRTRGGEGPVALLRSVVNENVPTSLLEAYGDIFIEFKVPADACEFSTRLGHFSCDSKAEAKIPFTIRARRSPYGEKPYDRYAGTFESVAIASEFYGKPGSRYLKFPMQFKVAGSEVATSSEFFFAHHWESEGFRQNPSCLVDNQFLVDGE